MALLTGRIESKKLSENEYSYLWIIGECLSNTLKSPTFGSICEEFSDCHLEIQIYNNSRTKIFMCFLYSSNEKCRSKFNFKAFIFLKEFYSPDEYFHRSSVNFTSGMKICQVESHKPYNLPIIFKLDIKLINYLTPETSILNSNVPNCDIKEENRASFDRVDENRKKSEFMKLKESIQVSRSLNTFNMDEKNKASIPINPSSPDQAVQDLYHSDTEEPKSVQHLDYPKELIQDLKSLYTSANMCDLDIRIGESVLRAHKLILCARSPVFKNMMEHDCLESSSSSITITDCPAPEFETFLKYLYTGIIEDRTTDTVMALYSLGDKYDVPPLREVCSSILQNKLSSKSVDDVANIVVDVLQLAECHSDSNMKKQATSFIVNHFPVVSNKPSWKDLMKSNFELTSEILALVVTACQKIQV